MPASTPLRRALACLAVAGTAACATPATIPTTVYSMPSDPSAARPPGEADPSSAAELAEGALFLLNPERPGGPDYVGAARMCLLATEAADRRVERDLSNTCYRVAARSALRSGDRNTYIEVVDRWESAAPRHERAAGELAVHLAIRSRLSQAGGPARVPVPPELRRLLPPEERSL